MNEKREETGRRIVALSKRRERRSSTRSPPRSASPPSTARKYLAGLVDAGELDRTEGGRDRGRKRPDRFSAVHGEPSEKEPKGRPTAPATKDRLGPGELDGLVLGYMREHRAEAPHTASRIGKGIGHSSGAVANCLGRLADSNRAALANEKPREYDLAEGE